MWDTVQDTSRGTRASLTHDLPCLHCGHAPHTYLVCSDDCACQPDSMPGTGVSLSA